MLEQVKKEQNPGIENMISLGELPASMSMPIILFIRQLAEHVEQGILLWRRLRIIGGFAVEIPFTIFFKTHTPLFPYSTDGHINNPVPIAVHGFEADLEGLVWIVGQL